jgi:uncharacterized linocin/CFP29 family protein
MEPMETQIDWTHEQWNQVKQTVADEVHKASIVGSFLPCFGPLDRSATVVRSQELSESDRRPSQPIKVDDVKTLKLWTLAVQVELNQQQLAEENLTGALSAFRRAANLLARAEDAIAFNGLQYTVIQTELSGRQYEVNATDPTDGELGDKQVPAQCKVTGGETAPGLFNSGQPLPNISFPVGTTPGTIPGPSPYSENLVTAVSIAISALEGNGHLGPFACVLGNNAFVEAHKPLPNSMVLPRDRMEPFLGMQLLRSSTLEPNKGIVVALAGDPIDLVVSTAPTVQFLNVNNDAKYLFRVYEKFVLRIKESGTVISFRLA